MEKINFHYSPEENTPKPTNLGFLSLSFENQWCLCQHIIAHFQRLKPIFSMLFFSLLKFLSHSPSHHFIILSSFVCGLIYLLHNSFSNVIELHPFHFEDLIKQQQN